MPRQRIPLRFTLRFKVKAIDSARAAARLGVSQRRFCADANLKRGTLQQWIRLESLLRAAFTATDDGPKPARRGSNLTRGGSGRTSKSKPIEDELLMYVKDLRREECVVTREVIIDEAMRLLPGFLEDVTQDGRLSWCGRFMKRTGLVIRRVTHSGRTSRSDLEKLQDSFVQDVVTVLITSLLDPQSRVTPHHILFNMDQTAVYAHAGRKTTVESVGARIVPVSTGGSESFRCTVALTVCADGRIFPPHFVYKGCQGADVQDEVEGYANDATATFSVQKNAWFDERVMLEWIEKSWKYIVTEPSLLILDSLKVHKMDTVLSALADMGTMVLFVPGGATGIAQPLDVGVMAPFKLRLRQIYSAKYGGKKPPQLAHEKRQDMFQRTMESLDQLTSDTVRNAFKKAGPFFPEGPAFEAP